MTLQPLPQKIGVFGQFFAQTTETVVLKERVMSLTGDSFDIKLDNGQPFLTVKGKLMSLSGRKSVYDTAGTHLFDIKKEHLHLHTTYAINDPDGKQIAEVKNNISLFGSKATATFTTPSTGRKESLKMKGNWFDTRAEIVDEADGNVVGYIDRKLLSGRDLIFSQQTYALVVAPGADKALLAALCICFDEKNNEEKGSS